VLVVDSGGLSYLAKRNQDAAATIRVFVRDGLWPPVVPSVVLVESTTGRQRVDANINRLVKTCDIVEELPEELARRAGELRSRARRGSAVDAILVATAEPAGTVLTGDDEDLNALASHAERVTIQRV
jgi:predicted nucleic acid-binding protein